MGKWVPETEAEIMARVDRMIAEGLKDGTIRVEEGNVDNNEAEQKERGE